MKKILTVSSLEKIFPDEKPKLLQSEYSVFKNEAFHYQIAYFSDILVPFCDVEIQSDIQEFVTVRRVEPIAGHLATKKGVSDDYLLKKKKDSTLYPDLLRPIRKGEELLREKKWTAFWVTINHEEKELPAGTHTVKILFSKQEEALGEATFTLQVLPAELPRTQLQYTNWIHYDCISQWHGFEPFTPPFYTVLNEYIKTAVAHGMTMLYTPLFTPTLDTKEGGERQTIQLVDVEVLSDGSYAFGFEKLKYFMENAEALGIQKFEFSHLATQWGAFFCPKIEAKKGDRVVKLFGWDTFACSLEYLNFIDELFKGLKAFCEENGYMDKIMFHVSDEPLKEHLDNFLYLKDKVRKYFPNVKIMDALSNIEFTKEKYVDLAIVPTSSTEVFRKEGLLKWAYYCTSQSKDYLSNRFFNMPSQRTRVLGIQLYENEVEGFLHWGFNFYNSYLSMYPIDPYSVTDAGGAYQSGDCFIVYPTKTGVDESLRLEVFYDGINDYRALVLLESLYGKAYVMDLLHREGVVGFKEYPKSANWHLAFREKVNGLIVEKLSAK